MIEQNFILNEPIVKAKLRFLKEMRRIHRYKSQNWSKRRSKVLLCSDLLDDGNNTICRFHNFKDPYLGFLGSFEIRLQAAFLVWLMSQQILPYPKNSAIVDAAEHYAAFFKDEFFPYGLIGRQQWLAISEWLYKEKHLITKKQYRFLRHPIITVFQTFIENKILCYNDY